MNRYGKRCVLYPRVSTEMQVDGYSLEGQKNMLTRFADREEMIIVDTYEDAGKSGKSIEGRPAFQKMLRDIEDGLDIDYILVYKLSRFGRNAADILNSLELVQSYGVNLICIEEGIDSSQTSGKLLISVLSAVAEIERENIIEQTMNGRREKARQGGWNGGFAPYGYTLEDNKLMIEETEAVAIRKIFELYTSSEIGLGGIANQLNLQGIRKIPRQNGTLEDWTGHFIKLILDNPVYCGKIAYGRRTKEKVKGTKNDYQMKRNDDYILTEGQHKGIVSEEVWEKAHAKRLRTGVKQPSKIGRDRVHLLSGLLKCPVCGSPMYTNKHAWTNKDGTYKEIYYYVCSRNRMVRGKHCEYKAMLKKTDIEPMVIEAIREIVRNEEYAQAIKKRIGVQIDTKAVDKELEGYQAKLKEVDLNKTRLEREIDSLPADAKYRERKLHDMTLRLDSLYDVIVELEEKIEDARLRRDAIKQQAITLENIYKIMVNFDCVYNIINDEEKRNVVTALIKEIEIYRNDESEYPLKRIGLNFPVFKDGGEVTELLWDKGNTVEMVDHLQGGFEGIQLERAAEHPDFNRICIREIDRSISPRAGILGVAHLFGRRKTNAVPCRPAVHLALRAASEPQQFRPEFLDEVQQASNRGFLLLISTAECQARDVYMKSTSPGRVAQITHATGLAENFRPRHFIQVVVQRHRMGYELQTFIQTAVRLYVQVFSVSIGDV